MFVPLRYSHSHPQGGVEPPRLRLWGLDFTSFSRSSRVTSASFRFEVSLSYSDKLTNRFLIN